MAKRSMNFRGRAGKHLTLGNLAATMKAFGKSNEEIIGTVKGIQEKLAATGEPQGNDVCACGAPLKWKRPGGSRWEGRCERGHEMGGKLPVN